MLKWNVYVEKFNRREIAEYNIFNHGYFLEDCRQAAKKHRDNKDDFEEAVRRSLMYYFWSKCEWEIILSDWPPSGKFDDKKVSVYDQVMLNWEIFINYLWENKGALR